MPRVPFHDLPDDARLWIFPVQDALDAGSRDALLERVRSFLNGWEAHGSPLSGACHWVEDRFLLVAVDQRSVPPSGCSIDAMVRVLKEMEGHLGRKLLDHGPVYARGEDGAVVRLTRKEFREGVAAGRFAPETRVFDTTLTSVGEWRGGHLERPARETWHGTAFFSG